MIFTIFFLFATYFDSDQTVKNYHYYIVSIIFPVKRINTWVKTNKARTFGLERASNEYKGIFNQNAFQCV